VTCEKFLSIQTITHTQVQTQAYYIPTLALPETLSSGIEAMT